MHILYSFDVFDKILTGLYLLLLLGETKLICWSKGPTDPILSKNKTRYYKILTNWIFLIYYCFLKKEKKRRNKTWQNYINNQNEEAFIVIIINYKLRVFLLYFLRKTLFLKKYRPFESNIFILPTDRPFFFLLSFP